MRQIRRVKISTAASGVTAILAADANQALTLLSLHLVSGGTVNVKIQEGSTDLTGAMPTVANGQVNLPYNPWGHCRAASGNALNLNLSAAVQVSGVAVVAIGEGGEAF